MSLSLNRVDALPSVLEPDSIYAVKRPEPGMLDLYFTGKQASEIRRTVSLSDINQTSKGSVRLVETLEQLSSIADNSVSLVYVVNPSAVAGVTEAPCWFYKDQTLDTFIKAPGSTQAYLNWADIADKPVSPVKDIDKAVADAHTHQNIDVLDKFQVDEGGRLTYKGDTVLLVVKNEW